MPGPGAYRAATPPEAPTQGPTMGHGERDYYQKLELREQKAMPGPGAYRAPTPPEPPTLGPSMGHGDRDYFENIELREQKARPGPSSYEPAPLPPVAQTSIKIQPRLIELVGRFATFDDAITDATRRFTGDGAALATAAATANAARTANAADSGSPPGMTTRVPLLPPIGSPASGGVSQKKALKGKGGSDSQQKQAPKGAGSGGSAKAQAPKGTAAAKGAAGTKPKLPWGREQKSKHKPLSQIPK